MRKAVFVPYQPKAVLSKHKRADHWFWTRYSAHPYTGCQHGCAFCYSREQKYSPYDDPDDFAYVIKVKENAPALLHRALSRVQVDVVCTADYQPAERKFGLSRKMLEVCHDLCFPVFVLERSPLVLRDLDLLQAINDRASAVVVFSVISTPDSRNYDRVRQMERLAPAATKRFAAMEKIAGAGIMTGACFMPILPGLCDDEANLESVVRWTADHGGRFVLAGGLTLSDQQRLYFFRVLGQRFPDLLPTYHSLYPPGSYGPAGDDWRRTARTVRELCTAHGIRDRMSRPVVACDKLALNKRVVEKLAERIYAMELDGEPSHRIWAYRKAAWAVDDLHQDIALVYREMGVRGLQSIPNVGTSLAGEIERLIVHGVA
ncbi:MAG: hypothetical protein AB1714_09155 [Acidobacteriota bacterium]